MWRTKAVTLFTKTIWHCDKSELLSILKKVLTLAAGGIILRFIPFLCTPFILKIISPAEYGIIALLQSFISFVVIFSGLGLRQALFINFFHCNSEQRKVIVSNIIFIYLIFATPLLLFCLLNNSTINEYCTSGYTSNRIISTVLIICFLSFFSELYYQVLTLRGDITKLIGIQTTIGIITAFTNVLLIFKFGLQCEGIFIGQLLGLILVNCLGITWYYQQSGYSYLNIGNALKNFKEYMSIGFPFIASMLFGWILASSNRWFLAYYTTLHDVGIYSLADTFGQFYQLLIMLPINNAYLPALMKKYSDNNNALLAVEDWNKKLMYCFLAFAVIFTFIGYCFAQIFLKLILPIKYHEALNYIGLILLSYICWTGTSFSLALVFYMKKIYPYLMALLITCLVSLILNFLLVPIFKVYGCLYATFISYLAYFLISLYCNWRVKNNIIESDQRDDLAAPA